MVANKKKDDYQYFQLITSEGLKDIEQSEKKESVFVNPVEKSLHRYSYEGPVMLWDRCVIDCFKTQTQAVSEAKAKSNIMYQVKKELDLLPSAGGVKLVNKIHLEA